MTMLVMRCLLFTAEALAVSTLLPLLAFLIGAFFRGRAALRHLLWLSAFAMLLILPLLALLVPAQVMTLDPGPAIPVVVTMAAPVTATYAESWSLEGIISAMLAPLCALWLAGMVFHLSRLALGAYGLHRLYARSTAFAGMDDVRLGDGGPMTFGLRKPVILLPRAAAHWPQARLDAVLRHERAHIRRHDSITQLLAELACAFYWPNPLVWLGARRLRRDAEIAADDAVLASGLQASAYATQLVQVAAEFAGSPRLMAMAMAAGSTLEARVTSVLSPEPSRKGVSRMDALKLAALGSVAAFALAMARPDLAWAEPVQLPVAVTQTGAVEPIAEAQAAPAEPSRHQRHSARVARGDVPDAPDVPDVPGAPPMPPVPPMPAMPATPAMPAMPPVPPMPVMHVVHRSPEMDAKIERAMARAERDREHAMAEAERARERAQASLERARDESERAMEIARAESEKALDRARDQTERALEQARAAQDSARNESRKWVSESVRQSMKDARPNTKVIVAQVRMEVGKALAEARVSREVALADAKRSVAEAVKQARAEARAAIRRAHENPPTED
jgi:beta-lactamase regulating signal transducer with metallopeptidase domain